MPSRRIASWHSCLTEGVVWDGEDVAEGARHRVEGALRHVDCRPVAPLAYRDRLGSSLLARSGPRRGWTNILNMTDVGLQVGTGIAVVLIREAVLGGLCIWSIALRSSGAVISWAGPGTSHRLPRIKAESSLPLHLIVGAFPTS